MLETYLLSTRGQAGSWGNRIPHGGPRSLLSWSFHSGGKVLYPCQGKIRSGWSPRNAVVEQTPSSLVSLFVPLQCVNASLQADGVHIEDKSWSFYMVGAWRKQEVYTTTVWIEAWPKWRRHCGCSGSSWPSILCPPHSDTWRSRSLSSLCRSSNLAGRRPPPPGTSSAPAHLGKLDMACSSAFSALGPDPSVTYPQGPICCPLRKVTINSPHCNFFVTLGTWEGRHPNIKMGNMLVL